MIALLEVGDGNRYSSQIDYNGHNSQMHNSGLVISKTKLSTEIISFPSTYKLVMTHASNQWCSILYIVAVHNSVLHVAQAKH